MKRVMLMIDDDEQVVYAVSRFLKRKDWDFYGAFTGTEGLKKASELHPDVVLLDVQLPDMEGWEICRRLKSDAALSGVSVVMVSGARLNPPDKALGLQSGADDFLGKPFNLTELLLRLDAIMRIKGK